MRTPNASAPSQPSEVHPIRRARHREGLSLAQCAVKAGIAVSTLQIAERGLVSERVAKRLARALQRRLPSFSAPRRRTPPPKADGEPMSTTTLDAAQQELAAAEGTLVQATEAHDREAARLEETNAEIRALTDELQAADPDADPKAFARTVGARDALRARAEALAGREAKARTALDAAQAAAVEARDDVLKAELASLDAEIRERDDALTREAIAAGEKLAAGVAELQRTLERANAVVAKLNGPSGVGHGTRGAYWNVPALPFFALRAALGKSPEVL
jgi:transcriptional regulator with XRE-family HTH domain